MSWTHRTKAVTLSLMLAFVLTLGAGMVVGMAAGRHASVPPPTTRPIERSWLAEQLKLSPEQRKTVESIWSETTQGPARKANEHRRMALMKERDEAVFNLLSDEQKARYQQLTSEYAAKLADMNKEREKAFQSAVEQTKMVLTDAQRMRYDQILKDHGPPHDDHGDHGQHGHHFGHGPPMRGEPRGEPPPGPRKEGSPDSHPATHATEGV